MTQSFPPRHRRHPARCGRVWPLASRQPLQVAAHTAASSRGLRRLGVSWSAITSLGRCPLCDQLAKGTGDSESSTHVVHATRLAGFVRSSRPDGVSPLFLGRCPHCDQLVGAQATQGSPHVIDVTRHAAAGSDCWHLVSHHKTLPTLRLAVPARGGTGVLRSLP